MKVTEKDVAYVADLAKSQRQTGSLFQHSFPADLLSRLGRNLEASRDYGAAVALTANAVERTFLERARHALPL